MRVFGYVRVSTQAQAKEGFSMAGQREAIADYCQQQGHELVRVYEDAGISGSKANEEDLTIDREGVQDMLADLKDSGISLVVVLTTSRLWRSDFTKILIQRELKKYDVDVRAIDRPTYSIYTQDPSEFLINGMMELLDQYEKLEIALKLKRGRNRKAKGGGYAGGGPAIGYTAARGSKALKVDRRKVATVRRAFELRQEQPGATLQQIADTLNREGHTTAQGKQFQPTTIKRILERQSLYSGVYSYSGIEAQGLHTAII